MLMSTALAIEDDIEVFQRTYEPERDVHDGRPMRVEYRVRGLELTAEWAAADLGWPW